MTTPHVHPPGDLLEVTLRTPIESEETVSALVEHVCGQVPVLTTHEETLITSVTVYFDPPQRWSPSRRLRLVRGWDRLRQAGIVRGPCRPRVRRLRQRDWAQAWKHHFKPLDIAGALLVKPSWSRRPPRRGQAVLTLDPGLSFGTGHHPTTRFCLEQIVAARNVEGARSFLDMGTGSGILALAAALLGYGVVEAFDFDPQAVTVARANARLNGVEDRIRLGRKDLTRLTPRTARPFDLVCANLLDDLLVAEAPRVVSRVKPGGRLVLAGVLEPQFDRVQKVYLSLGLSLADERSERGWRSTLWVSAGLT